MTGETIYAALSAALSGTTLTLTPATFGPAAGAGIADVLTEYFPPDGKLVIEGVTLAQQGDIVTLAGATGASVPLNGMAIGARFAPGSGGVEMTLTATPPAGWLFSAGWPLLANGCLDQLSVTEATLTLSSVAVPQGAAKGITFAGLIGFPADWSALLWLLGSAPQLPVSGPIGQQGTAPSFALSAKSWSAELPVLGPLSISLVFSSTPVPGAPRPPGGFAYVPQTALGVSAEIVIAGAKVPIFADLSVLGGTVPIMADVSGLPPVKLTDLASVLDQIDLSAAMPPPSGWDPGLSFTLKALLFTLNPAAKQLISVGLNLGTTTSWPITPGLSAGPVTLTFLIDIAERQVFAALAGDINFTGGSLGLGAYYPGFVFTGGLSPGSRISLSSLLSPVLTGAPALQALVVDQLGFVVRPLKGGSFSLFTGLTGDWSFPVGTATLALTNAYLQLDRPGGASSAGTSGMISARGQLTPPPGTGDPIAIDASLALPGGFSLTGKVPDLHLSELARKLTGIPPAAGLPEIDLTSGEVAVALNSATGDYTLAVTATASAGGTTLGSAIFAVRRAPGTFGFIAGVVANAGWSPAKLSKDWSDALGGVFDNLTFRDSGVLVSTLPSGSAVGLPGMNMPSLPGAASPGFTFFSTLELQGPILGPLAGLFDQGVTLGLLAMVNIEDPKQSKFQAVFTGLSHNNAVAWTSVLVAIVPDPLTLTIQAAVTLTIQDEQLSLAGQGTISMDGPSARLTLMLAKAWAQPFGVADLVIEQFGLQIGLESAGVTIGLLGSFVIGTGPRTFTLLIGGSLIDFEAPGALIFRLQSNDPQDPLMLYDVIRQFTSLDLSSVPVLNAIGFKELAFAVVDDPAGFVMGDYRFPPGIGIAADILVHSWEAKFNLQVSKDHGIVGSGSINQPIKIGEVFSLSDATGQTGPSGSIDTSRLPDRTDRLALEQLHQRRALRLGDEQPYFTLDGKLAFLGLDATITASAAGKTFDFDLDFAFLNTVTAHLACHLVDAANFAGDAEIGFNLDVTVGPYEVDGITLIPQVHIQSPGATLGLAIKVAPPQTAELDLELKFELGRQ